MAEFISQLEGMQDEEHLYERSNRLVRDSGRVQVTGSLRREVKQFFYTSCSPWHGERQEMNRIHISDIIQLLRTTKLQQCRGIYHHGRRFCTLGAIMHEKYGWYGHDSGFICEIKQQLCAIFGENAICSKIIALNDQDGKSFSQIADWLERSYLADWN